MTEVLDLLGAVFLLAGTIFCLAAAVGVVRFPDVLTRLHAATKPQVFGLMLVLTGVALTLRTWHVVILRCSPSACRSSPRRCRAT